MATGIAVQRNASEAAQEQQAAAQQVLGIISGFWLSRAVQVAATLEIPDLLADGPRDANDLAAASRTHAPSLYRLLRALASAGVLRELPGQCFEATALSNLLRKDVPGSMRSTAITELGLMHYASWGNLIDTLRTGDYAFQTTFQTDPWTYLKGHPELGAIFNDSMTNVTKVMQRAILEAYDFSPYRKIVDLGGGQGLLLKAMLEASPQARGVLFDAPQVVEQARQVLRDEPAAERIEFDAGDFFQGVTAGGDLYTMKWILHDWADAESRLILQNIRKVMAPGARVLVLDMVLPEPNVPDFGPMMDLNMLVMTGGRERTEAEFADLLTSAGLRLRRVYTTKSPLGIVEAEAAE
ncbi:methyltransferase [uncultured Paludibaculum sp.]|uniref:methyltransferase n=1 Tax=uncultured Paludibaculum sp. TaxID=1765020 RepID=UPI002AAB3842|nr:methyltransferase [uncultured Paludibaculum sp.]